MGYLVVGSTVLTGALRALPVAHGTQSKLFKPFHGMWALLGAFGRVANNAAHLDALPCHASPLAFLLLPAHVIFGPAAEFI